MVIELNPKYEQRLRELAKASGKTVTEVVESAVERALHEQETRAEGKMSPEMKADMLARIDEIRALSQQAPADGFCCENHDDVIYRIDW